MIKKIVFTFLILITLSFLISSCQEVFTYSALEGLQRDPEDLSDDEKIGYGRSALESGNLEYIRKAYAVIKPLASKYPNDLELKELYIDLAIAAAGVQDEILNSLDAFLDPDGTGDDADEALNLLEDAMANMDTDNLVDALDSFDSIPEEQEVSETLYLNTALVAVVLVAQAYEQPDGSADLDSIDFSLLPDVAPADGVPDVPSSKPIITGINLNDPADIEDAGNSNANTILLLQYALWASNQGGVESIDEYFE